MPNQFEELLTKIQSSHQLQRIKSPINLISFGSPNLPYTSAEVISVYSSKQIALIFFFGRTENYQGRMIAISQFQDQQEFTLMKKEIEQEMHFDLTKSSFNLFFEE